MVGEEHLEAAAKEVQKHVGMFFKKKGR